MALPGVVDFATMSGYVKDHLAKSPAEILQPHWDSIINAAITTGYWHCVNAWIIRGYTKEQVDDWDRLAEYQLDIGAWFALKRLSAMIPDSLGQANLDKLDRRAELQAPQVDSFGRGNNGGTAVLTIDGVPVDGEGTYGQPNTGPMDTTHDMFVPAFYQQDDSRLGQLTKF